MNQNQTRWMMMWFTGALCCVFAPACADEETTACVLNGEVYAVGESVPAVDGCNTCVCGATADLEGCTEMACCGKYDNCGEGAFCDFPDDDCGVWEVIYARLGTCAALPDTCDTGGTGACGCDGSWATNRCELNAQGIDKMEYGGCQGADPVGLFACGDTECNIETQFCSISLDDAINHDGSIDHFSACGELPVDCKSGDCSCMTLAIGETCYDATGYTMVFAW